MANSLLRLKQRFSANSLITHVLRKSFSELNVSTSYRSIMTIALHTDTTIPDIVPPHQAYRHGNELTPGINSQMLKKKEKGDWRFLTMEERKQLYQMSFNQSCDMAPDDEWKTILAGTFTAMGLMTMGIYFWLIQLGDFWNVKQPPVIVNTFPEHSDQTETFFSDEKTENESFNSQLSH